MVLLFHAQALVVGPSWLGSLAHFTAAPVLMLLSSLTIFGEGALLSLRYQTDTMSVETHETVVKHGLATSEWPKTSSSKSGCHHIFSFVKVLSAGVEPLDWK